MAEKSEFHGDVGQAVMGDVNEAPRLNNVVHVNLASEKTKSITNLQRKSIAAKVKELMALGDLEQLDVYRVILTDFGIETIAELPCDRYKSVMTLLDDWMVETRGQTAPSLQRRTTDQIVQVNSAAPSCSSERIIKAVKSVRLMAMMQTVVIVVSIVILGRLILSVPASASVETSCRIDGKAYSVGSTAKMSNGGLRECLAVAEGGAPFWAAPQKAGR
jgi:hypothetical protein